MKYILLLIATLFYVATGYAQNNLYAETKTFYEDGYTYQCDVPKHKLLRLYNKGNKWTYVPNIDKRTGYPYNPTYRSPDIVKEDYWTKETAYRIVNQAFSPEQKVKIAGNILMITMYASSETGKVEEVDFNFLAVNSSPYTQIPISVFREIEVNLKKQIYFEVTEEGKNLKYIMICWTQDPNETIKTTHPVQPGPKFEIEEDDKFQKQYDPDDLIKQP